MRIFAWILFSLFIFVFTAKLAIIIGKCIASAEPTNKVSIDTNIISISFDIVSLGMFVFICIYLFA